MPVSSGKLAAFASSALACLSLLACVSPGAGDVEDAAFWLAPSPKKLETGPSARLLPPYSVSAEAMPSSPLAAGFLKETLSSKLGWTEAKPSEAKSRIRLLKASMPDGEEAYGLETREGEIVLSAASEAGFWRGAGRLAAILDSPMAKRLPDGSLELPSLKIVDWPDIQARGMHLQMSFQTSSEDLIKRTIDAMAELGFNFVVLEVGGRFESRKHPECARKPWWTQEQIRSLVKYAKSRGIDPIPGINGIGHVDRSFNICVVDKKLMNIADPKFYGLYFDMLDELVELFDKPRFFHLGTDEFHLKGVDLELAKLSGKSGGEYYAEFLDKASEHLKGKGVKAVVWHDMLLQPLLFDKKEEANGAITYPALNMISKDLAIDYWCYSSLNRYGGLELIASKGFETWATPWRGEMAIRSLCAAAGKAGVKTVLGSTWSNNFADADAFVQTAEYSWNSAKAQDSAWKPAYAPWGVANRLLYSKEGSRLPEGMKSLGLSGVARPSAAYARALKASFPELRLSTRGASFKIDESKSFLASEPEQLSFKGAPPPGKLQGKDVFVSSGPRSGECVRIDGFNIPRGAKQAVIYTPDFGETTRTNQYGSEWAIRNGEAFEFQDDVGDMPIPKDGFVVSAHRGDSGKYSALASVLSSGRCVLSASKAIPESMPPVSIEAPPSCETLAILLASEFPIDAKEDLGEISIELSDGHIDSFKFKGSIFKWSYPSAAGNWSLWSAWQGRPGGPLEGSIAGLEWRRPANGAWPKKISVSPSIHGIQAGLLVLGAMGR